MALAFTRDQHLPVEHCRKQCQAVTEPRYRLDSLTVLQYTSSNEPLIWCRCRHLGACRGIGGGKGLLAPVREI